MYDIEREQIARRRKLMEAMTQRAMTPQGTQVVSGRAVPNSLVSSLSPLLQAYMAKKGMAGLDVQQQALDTKEAVGIQDAMKSTMEQYTGAPEEVMGEGEFGPPTPAVQADPTGAAMSVATDPYLSKSKPAQAMMQQLMKNKGGASSGRPYFSPKESVIYDDAGRPSIKTEVFDHRTGEYLPSKVERISPKDPRMERLRSGAKEGGKKTEGGKIERYQTWVNDGISAADSMTTTKRAKDLLSDIRTSGFNSVLLRAKQWLGVEGADEGQLSANLGKAVLAQLRPTFGAQFTEREGAKLERIEAGFGSSVESNIRLLDQALQIFNREARRGQNAAKKLGDDFSYDEIGKAMKMELTNPEKPKKIQTGLEYKDQVKEDAYQKWKAMQ